MIVVRLSYDPEPYFWTVGPNKAPTDIQGGPQAHGNIVSLASYYYSSESTVRCVVSLPLTLSLCVICQRCYN